MQMLLNGHADESPSAFLQTVSRTYTTSEIILERMSSVYSGGGGGSMLTQLEPEQAELHALKSL